MAVAVAVVKWVIRRTANRVPLAPLQVAFSGRRFYGSSSNSADATAIEMVNYARSHSRPLNATSYPEALRVLEQGLSIFQGDDASTANAAGRLLLAMATLNVDRGDIRDAMERLKQAADMTYSSIEIRVAALEALTGVHLRMHQDVIASDYGDRCLHLLENAGIKANSEKALEMRAKAIKGLVELACGRVDSAESYFSGWNVKDIKNRNGLGGHNQKVGIVLLCIADMFGHKGRSEGASYFLIQEGLYRRSLEMMKAPSLDQEGFSKEIDQKDVIALARGGYAQLLLPQRNRAAEAEKMKHWANVVWENNRTTLAKVLEKTETSIDKERKMDATVVTDMRLGRVF